MESSVSTFNAGMRFGLFTGLALIAFDLILYVAGLKDPADPNPVQHMAWIILIAGIIMGIKYFKDNNEGIMSLGEAMGSGTIVAVIAALIGAAYLILFLNFIDPAFIEEVRAVAKQQAMEQNNLSEEDYEQMAGMMNTFTSPTFLAISSVIIYAIIGAIISLIGGLIMRSKSQV
jgi:uncharacterized membrane protein (DUF106 family)